MKDWLQDDAEAVESKEDEGAGDYYQDDESRHGQGIAIPWLRGDMIFMKREPSPPPATSNQ